MQQLRDAEFPRCLFANRDNIVLILNRNIVISELHTFTDA
jgi:hypothetical protein